MQSRMWCWMVREKDGPRMGWGSEVREESVPGNASGRTTFSVTSMVYLKPVAHMAKEDPEPFQVPTENGTPPSPRTFKGQVQKWNLNGS